MKLDPTAYDRWWRSRIEKEEKRYGSEGTSPSLSFKDHAMLNSLGTAQVVPAAEMHLTGAAAIVSPTGYRAPLPGAAAAAYRTGSVASGKQGNCNGCDSVARMLHKAAGSLASVPRVPADARSQGTNASTLARRLDALEDALAEERIRRKAAEEEMRQLQVMAQQNRQQPPLGKKK